MGKERVLKITFAGLGLLGLFTIVQAATAVEPSAVVAAGCEEIVFAQRVPGHDHWYGNFGHYSDGHQGHYAPASTPNSLDYFKYAFGNGGRLCRLNLRTGKLTVLLDDPQGGIRDPDVHYDGQKILFSYRKGGTTVYHLYEIDTDGRNLRQLTDGPDNDIEPIYTPDGSIVFCSSRCHRFVPCWKTQVATLYRCNADGSGIRMLSNNAEQENTPWMLPDGRVLYMRWEYVDRNQLLYHHLWSINPDGTGVMVYFGNQYPGYVMIDAKPIPNSRKIVASFSPGHGLAEHAGYVTVVDPRRGPDDMEMARRISQATYRDPYPLAEDLFLVADAKGIHALNGDGKSELIYAPKEAGPRWQCHEPRPLRARKREPILPNRFVSEQPTGRLVLSDVYAGRNMTGVERGEIKKLLVLEQLPKPVNFSGGSEPLSVGGTFTLQRVLGTVPVEADGSASFEVPALRSLFFVALDENEMSVKRMQSFVTVQPGETTSCVGCHEQRTQSPHLRDAALLDALKRPTSRIEPYADLPDVLDFPRDIQPIFDRHCVACHNHDRTDGGVNLSGDRTPYYSTAYWTMFSKSLVVDGRNQYGNRPPRGIGTSASRLTAYLDESHYEVKLSDRERRAIRVWIDSGATYSGTYACLGSGMYPVDFPEETVINRCAECHKATKESYRNVKKDAFYFQFGRQEPPQPLLERIDDIILIRHLAYFQLGEAPLYQALCNLDRPAHSLFLRAPLAKSAGGLELCGKPVIQDTTDKDYREILARIEDASRQLQLGKRFDMPGFRPNRYYIRQMQLFGVLALNLPADAPIDPYATDQAYWRTCQGVPGDDQHAVALQEPEQANTLRLVQDSVLDPEALNFAKGTYGTCINGQTFQIEAMASFQGWQYATYFDARKRLCVARRQLPKGEWQRIAFDDYTIDHTDVHNVAVLGICPTDGTIHLSFDHHGSPLHYRVSRAAAATAPEKASWTAKLFGPVTAELVKGQRLTGVTYPAFFNAPDGRLLLSYRIGGSGNGKSCLACYDPKRGGWTTHGVYIGSEGEFQGSKTRNAYHNGFDYDSKGRLHTTWVWREGQDNGQWGLLNCHGLQHAFSEDHGLSWRNSNGKPIGATGKEPIQLDSPGLTVRQTRWRWGLMNQLTQTVDDRDRLHVVLWQNPPDAPAAAKDLNGWRYFHYWRDEAGRWHERQLPFFGRKPSIVADRANNLFVVFTKPANLEYHGVDPGGPLCIFTASAASDWTDWREVFRSEMSFVGEPRVDRHRWREDGVLSIYAQQTPSQAGKPSCLRVMDFQPAGGRSSKQASR